MTGTVHRAVTERHRSRECMAFLWTLDAACPIGMLVCILLDNHAAHRSRETRRHQDSKPNHFEPVFTPTHASWLNWTETFSSKTARSVLRHVHVASKAELTSRIGRHIEKCTPKPNVPKWPFHNDRPANPPAALTQIGNSKTIY